MYVKTPTPHISAGVQTSSHLRTSGAKSQNKIKIYWWVTYEKTKYQRRVCRKITKIKAFVKLNVFFSSFLNKIIKMQNIIAFNSISLYFKRTGQKKRNYMYAIPKEDNECI